MLAGKFQPSQALKLVFASVLCTLLCLNWFSNGSPRHPGFFRPRSRAEAYAGLVICGPITLSANRQPSSEMHVYVCIYIYRCVHTLMHMCNAYIYMYICYMHAFTHVRTYMRLCVCLCICLCVCLSVCLCVCIHLSMYVCICLRQKPAPGIRTCQCVNHRGLGHSLFPARVRDSTSSRLCETMQNNIV